MAVDQETGDLLVIDVGNPPSVPPTLSRWHADGTPSEFPFLSSNVIDETPEGELKFNFGNPREVQVAVDNSGGATDGDIYLVQPKGGPEEKGLISIFARDGEFLGQLTDFKEGANASGPLKKFGRLTGVAVDPLGAVYVSDDTNEEIHKYVPAANPVANGDSVANFSRASTGLAAGAGPTNGFLFADTFGGEMFKLDSSSGELQYGGNPISNDSVVLTVNPANGNLLSATETKIREYDASGSTEAVEEGSGTPVPGPTLKGIAVDGASGAIYVSRGAGNIEVWEAKTLPEAITEPATEVQSQSATLNGSANPNGSPLTECFFEWGETTSYGETADCEDPNAEEVGSGSTPVPVHADLPNLNPGTTYHFQLVLANAETEAEELEIKGGDEEFLTAGPVISEETASQINATEAKISGLIDPKGEETEFQVEYLTKAQFEANGGTFAGALKAPSSPVTIPAQTTGTGDLTTAEGTGNLAQGFSQVTNVHATSGTFAIGETISGPGIPPQTTITALDAGKQTLTLSNAAETSGTAVPLSSGSTTVTALTTSAGRFTPGQEIEGPGIAPETTITSVSAGKLTISKPPTENLEATPLTATGPQSVSQQLSGLTPATTYHFRLTATNGAATSKGEDRTFATFAPPTTQLPDGRAYEMVSPAQKGGEVIPPEPVAALSGACFECLPGPNNASMPMQSTPSGNSVLYLGQPFSAGLAATPNEYVAARGAGGWASQSISPQQTTGRYEAFSSDLSRSILYQVEPPLSPEAPSRGSQAFANLYLREASGTLQPLLTEEPPNRDPGEPQQFENQFRIAFGGANSGAGLESPFSHVIFEANDALTGLVPGIAPPAPKVKAGEACTFAGAVCNLYEWSEEEGLALVNVLPGNDEEEAATGAVIGSGRVLTGNSELLSPDVDHAISEDGSRIFWSDETTGHVFARIDGEETLQIPGPASCKQSLPFKERVCFLTASPDGSLVLISDGKLYELNEEANEGKGAYEEVADLTEEEGGFKGILGAAEDLSRVYFIDTEVLTGSEENANEEAASEGEPNLYLWEEGETTFIGTLVASDNELGVEGRFGAWNASPSNRTAQVSTDGEFLAFMSRAPLQKGFDNSARGGGNCGESNSSTCREVYEYAAATGKLTCASCNPSGQRPLASSNLSLIRPGATGAVPFRQPGNLSRDGNGRLFFESQDALSPSDTNGQIQDVYEWEPNGVGSCKSQNGCVSLISSGHSANLSMFLDSTPSGNDAFFITREQLVPADKDQQLDLYDARVPHVPGEEVGFPNNGTGPCDPEGCAGPPSSPPAQSSAPSSSLNGPGNPPRQKPKHHKKKHHKKKHHKTNKRGGSR